MDNILIIGNRSFFIMNNTRVYNGTERMLEVIIRSLSDDYHEFLLCDDISNKLIDMYNDEYDCENIGHLPTGEEFFRYIESNNINKIIMSGWVSEAFTDCINNCLSKCQIPVYIMLHGTNCSGTATDFVKAMTSNENIKLIVMTDHEQKLYVDNGFPVERVRRIDNPVDLGSVTPYYLDPNTPPIIEDSIVIARMQVEKGITNSAELCKHMGTKLAVRGKKYRGYVVRQLQSMYPDNHYIVEPMPRDDLLQFEKQFRFFILLNNIPEGQNLSVLEANALGVPVICWKNPEYAYSKFLDSEFNIFLDKKPDFADQFMREYYPRLDFYLDKDNRRELSRRTYDRFRIETYKKNLLEILRG